MKSFKVYVLFQSKSFDEKDFTPIVGALVKSLIQRALVGNAFKCVFFFHQILKVQLFRLRSFRGFNFLRFNKLGRLFLRRVSCGS